jgi:DNA-directed RNA polymerase specialized sigma24 family protein
MTTPAATDLATFERCLRLHGPRLLALAERLLGARDAALAAFADGCAAAAPRTAGSELALLAALRRGVVAACLRRLPQAGGAVAAAALRPAFVADGHRRTAPSGATAAAASALQGVDGARRLRGLIGGLPGELRVVLVLRDLEQFDEDATAAALGIDATRVRERLHLARHGLCELLAREAPRSA